jgi:hypothetical protein
MLYLTNESDRRLIRNMFAELDVCFDIIKAMKNRDSDSTDHKAFPVGDHDIMDFISIAEWWKRTIQPFRR